MATYIDADDGIYELKRAFPSDDFGKIVRCISRTPTADVVKVVRCKDCTWCHKAVFAKYWNGEEIERCYCDIHKRYTSDEYYCADGERREDGKEK